MYVRKYKFKALTFFLHSAAIEALIKKILVLLAVTISNMSGSPRPLTIAGVKTQKMHFISFKDSLHLIFNVFSHNDILRVSVKAGKVDVNAD